MKNKIALILIIFLLNQAVALNLEPLPKSFTHTIKIMPEYKLMRFASIDLSSVGGSASSLISGYQLGLKWNELLSGVAFYYGHLSSASISLSGTEYTTTDILYDEYKIRFFMPIISDDSSAMTAFISGGKYTSAYTIASYIESSGSSAYVKRYQDGFIIDGGIIFSYQMNADWILFLAPSYQITLQDSIYTPSGADSSDISIDFKGAGLSIGTALAL